MKNVTLILFCLYGFLCNAQNLSLDWAVRMGSTGDDRGYSIDLDASGNVYTTGYFEGTVDFNPGAGVFNLTSAGDYDIFISKLDAAGNFVWAVSFGGSAMDIGQYLSVDAAGNLFITGNFQGTVDFNPGAGFANLSSAGVNDAFILKLDATGSFIWAKQCGGSNFDSGRALTVDASGNVYVTGVFSATADFDPGTATYNLTSLGGFDLFTMKLDATGNFIWAKAFGGTDFDEVNHMVMDASGNTYTTGYFGGTVDFDPGATTYNLTAASTDGFITKLDAAGNFVWAKTFGGSGADWGYTLALNGSGDLYATGVFNNAADLDPGTGVASFTSAGGDDVFISRLDAAGNFVWAKAFGGTGDDQGIYITLGSTGDIYATGHFKNTVDFDPGAATYNLVSAGDWDFYITRLDDSGNFVSAESFGSTGTDFCMALDFDNAGNIYTTGLFETAVDFDPETGIFNLTAAGSSDSYVQKLTNTCMATAGTDMQSACSSYTWIDGVNYTASNTTATHTLVNAAGCDSIVTLNLSIKQPTSSIFTESACGGYTLNAQTYTVSGTYTQHLVNVAGCDSTITLNLTIKQPTASILNISSCGGYTLNAQTYIAAGTYTQTLTNAAGCDSTITLNLTIKQPTTSSLTESACGSYTLNAQTYTTSGTYTQHLTNVAGCDSTITLNLTIKPLTTATLTENACGSYTLNTQTYTTSGTYTQHLTNTAGCDSTITLNLTIKQPTASTISYTTCGDYTLNAETYTASGTYTQHLTNTAGCDSTLTLHLTIGQPASVLTETSCESYALNVETYTTSGTYTQMVTTPLGCDSTITLHLTITQPTTSTLTHTSCGNYTLNAETYTSGGTYTQVIENAAGCDSTITLHLTITQPTTSTLTHTSCGNYTLNAETYTSGGTYTQVIENAAGCDSTITLNLTIALPTTSSLTETACTSYALNAQTYTASGTYTQVIENIAGCDSTITLNLTIAQPTTSTLTQTACGSYTLNTQTYTTGGTYTQVIENAAGCDSTITLNLTITQNSASTLTETACESYTLNAQTYTASGTYTQVVNTGGCDSVITLHLIIGHPTASVLNQTGCNDYTLNGHAYYSSGTYYQVLTSATGCDSTITLHLTMSHVNTNLKINGMTLMATMPGATCQWINCSSGNQVAGATNQSFTAPFNGSYAAIVTIGGCSDTSTCITLPYLGLEDLEAGSIFSAFPNPTDGKLTVSLNGITEASILLFNINGQLVFETTNTADNEEILDLSTLAPGVYYIAVASGQTILARERVIKE